MAPGTERSDMGRKLLFEKTTTADESEREFTNVFYKYDIGDLEVIPEIR